MTQLPRLSRSSLAGLDGRPHVSLPPKGWDAQRAGIVHFGIGAFHRAHQAVFTQDAFAASADDRWGIVGVTQRSDSVQRQLLPQDCLYSVLTHSPEGVDLQLIGSVRDVLYPAEQQAELDALIAGPDVQVITLTVTEKGYRRNAEGGLDLTDPAVAADLAGGAPASAIGRLVRGLQRRADGPGTPITVVSCDNLADNGRVLERLVRDYCAALPDGDELAAWIDGHVAFPCTMVDRIVPATTPADRELGEELLGLHDEGLVSAEPFKQWVIEDRFVAERPAWERVGAQIVQDVAPFEAMKLRILNGSHSTLAYLGALRGYATIVEAVGDPELHRIAESLIQDDVIPVLTQPEGVDLPDYGRLVLGRYANPALAHKTTQIAMDGSQKLPLRLLGTIRDNLAAGRTPSSAIAGVAGWMTYLATPSASGLDLPIDDPMAATLSSVRGETDANALVDRLLGVQEVFGDDLPADGRFVSEVRARVGELLAVRR